MRWSRIQIAFADGEIGPAYLTERLKVQPTRSWRKGEPMRNQPQKVYTAHGWLYELSISEPFEFETSLDRLLAGFPDLEALADCSLRHEGYVGFYIYLPDNVAQSDYVCSATLRRLANLNLGWDMAIHSVSDSVSASSASLR